jgi:hypothetical protein
MKELVDLESQLFSDWRQVTASKNISDCQLALIRTPHGRQVYLKTLPSTSDIDGGLADLCETQGCGNFGALMPAIQRHHSESITGHEADARIL